MTDQTERHPSNAPGDFYVTNGCCTACGVPESICLSLFASDADGHCFVRQQPSTPNQVDGMLRVLRTQELECIRYAGRSPDLLKRLGEAGESQLCDEQLSPPATPVERVRALVGAPEGKLLTVEAEGRAARSGLLELLGERGRATELEIGGASASFRISWFEDVFHLVEVRAIGDSSSEAELLHSGPVGLSDLIDDYLRGRGGYAIEWTTRDGKHPAPRPW